jgi:hypothetical protein
MRLVQNSIVGSVLFLTMTVMGQASVAVTLIPSQPGATENWRPSQDYNAEDGFFGTVEVDTRLWNNPLPVGGSKLFNITLALWSFRSELGFFGWNFKSAPRELQGSFKVRNYLACGYGTLCGLELPIDPDEELRDDGVGASFLLQYNPASQDPQPGQGRIHWIQMARASFAGRRPGYVSHIPFIDNRLGRSTPYADDAVPEYINENSFLDIPYNPGLGEARKNQYFEAQLHLVEETTSPNSRRREVNIYDGIRWGWKSQVSRDIDDICPLSYSTGSACPPPPPPPPPCYGSSGGGGCVQTLSARTASQRSSIPDSDKTSQKPISIPESTSALGLLALVAWSVVKALKIHKDKQS